MIDHGPLWNQPEKGAEAVIGGGISAGFGLLGPEMVHTIEGMSYREACRGISVRKTDLGYGADQGGAAILGLACANP